MDPATQTQTDLGCFSVSLAVKDIHKSLAFYEALGFEKLDGNLEQNWIILKNGEARIGLFQGMFDSDLLTFNPSNLRDIEAGLKEKGIAIDKPTEGDDGPCHMTLTDPDGRTILLDQH